MKNKLGMLELKTTYKAIAYCSNCGKYQGDEVPLRQTRQEYYSKILCFNCGCRALELVSMERIDA